jgi:carbon storage regulator
MLVITRKEGQSFLVGDDVRVNILSVDKNQIRIGIDAPREIKILRSELKESGNAARIPT